MVSNDVTALSLDCETGFGGELKISVTAGNLVLNPEGGRGPSKEEPEEKRVRKIILPFMRI